MIGLACGGDDALLKADRVCGHRPCGMFQLKHGRHAETRFAQTCRQSKPRKRQGCSCPTMACVSSCWRKAEADQADEKKDPTEAVGDCSFVMLELCIACRLIKSCLACVGFVQVALRNAKMSRAQ